MIIRIDNIDDPSISLFLDQREKERKKLNVILAESYKIVTKLLKSSYKVNHLFCSDEFYHDHFLPLSSELTYKPKVSLCSEDLFKKTTGYNHHHGAMALLERPAYSKLDELSNGVIILNGLTAPENIGTIVRTAAAFNLDLIFDAKSCDPYLKRAIRVSMGNIFHIKLHKSENLLGDLEKLKGKNYKIIGTGNFKNSLPIQSFNFSKKLGFIIGSEGHGLDKEIVDSLGPSASLVKIPVDNLTEHLNAAAAAAIFSFQYRTQWPI
jgi:tRNA G18 (ribose-2'-O)-methylase SpoU